MAIGITWVYNTLGFVGGAVFGLLYAPICLTGMHHSFIAIETQLLAASSTTGGSFIFPIAAMNNVAQGAAVMAVLFATKNKKMKSICSASGVSAFLGITEPAMFGVTLKLRYPFYGAMIGSACGGAYVAATKTLAVALGTAGLPGFISIAPDNWLNYFIGMGISIIVSFVVTTILFKKYCEKDEIKEVKIEAEKNIIYAPLQGIMKSVEECSDPMFASKAMGNGVIIVPTEGVLTSPVQGKVTMIFPTKHAIGLESKDGVELLIHVGLDTVKLDGKPFDVLVEVGQEVSVGEKLMNINLDVIQKEGLSLETPVLITNQKEFEMFENKEVKYSEKIMRVK